MSLRNTTAILSFVAIAALLVFSGCGGGGGDGNGNGTTPTPPPDNDPPQIQSVTAPDTAFPGSAVSIEANATDPDGDSLTYAWTASDGAIDGSGASVTWTAPVDSGDVDITVTVTDGNQGQAEETVTITVEDIGPPPPPPF
ncbi:MAG: Ig-like domain-containing protein [Armatimonadota bacterium]